MMRDTKEIKMKFLRRDLFLSTRFESGYSYIIISYIDPNTQETKMEWKCSLQYLDYFYYSLKNLLSIKWGSKFELEIIKGLKNLDYSQIFRVDKKFKHEAFEKWVSRLASEGMNAFIIQGYIDLIANGSVSSSLLTFIASIDPSMIFSYFERIEEECKRTHFENKERLNARLLPFCQLLVLRHESNADIKHLEKLYDFNNEERKYYLKNWENYLTRILSLEPSPKLFLVDKWRFRKLLEIAREKKIRGFCESYVKFGSKNYDLSYQKGKLSLIITRERVSNIKDIEGIERLQDLDGIFLWENKITEIEGLEEFNKLEILGLQKNLISEIKGLDTLINLKELLLNSNNISKITGLEKLTKLKVFSAYSNKITKIEGLNTLHNLEILYLSGNLISGIKGLKNLKKLKELRLYNNNILELKDLDSLVSLENLLLHHNKITEIKGLENLTDLKYLNLSDNQISEIKGLDNLKNLKKLDLGHNQISEIKGLETLTNLEVLDLRDNQITEIKGLEKLINLKNLFLDTNKIEKIQGLDTLNNLEKLHLAENNIVEIKNLDNLKILQDLGLSMNKITGLKGLENLLRLHDIGLTKNLIPRAIYRKCRADDFEGFDARKCVEYCRNQIPKENWKKEWSNLAIYYGYEDPE